MKVKTVFARVASLVAFGLLAACAEAEAPPAGDEANTERLAAEDAPQTELLFYECTTDTSCGSNHICVNVPFGKNYCAQLCYYVNSTDHTCPPGYECTRPFPYTARRRCVLERERATPG